MITPGQKLDPALPLTVVRAGAEAKTTLGQLLRRRTILSVYMKNNTSSCDRQVDSLAAAAPAFARAGYDIVAVSRDSCGSHLRYAAKKQLPYPLVSDPDDAVARATDSVVMKSMYGRTYPGPARAAYVLERDGTVLAVVEKVDPKDHAAQLRAVLQAL
ncbi:MAG: redoxin domain-containing protein [Opitutaceae bacterium]